MLWLVSGLKIEFSSCCVVSKYKSLEALVSKITNVYECCSIFFNKNQLSRPISNHQQNAIESTTKVN